MQNQFLHKLLKTELEDIYSAEQQIMQAQPTLIEKASNPELKKALQTHMDETTEQIRKIKDVAGKLNISLEATQCMGMQGIIAEAKKHLETMQPSTETDLEIIALAQRIEHYEIAGYGTARNYALKMAHDDAAQMLHEIGEQEGHTDQMLSKMADTIITEEMPQE